MKFACLLSDGFEDIEALGTVDILRRAGIKVDFISVFDKKIVKASSGSLVIPDKMMNAMNESDYDGLFIPGGGHSYVLRETQSVLELTKKFYDNDKWLMSICAGPMTLGVLGILNNRKYISYPGTEDSMGKAIRVESQAVRDGKIITGKAAGAVFEFAFKIIETVLDEETMIKVKERLFYK